MARPRKFDEAEVVRVARDQFWDGGYAATSLDDVCEVTGLGRGSLYGAFGDKHALYLRTLDSYCTEAVAGWRDALDGAGSAMERLENFVQSTASQIAGDVDRRGCMLAKAAAELSSGDADVAKKASDTFHALHAVLTASVAEAQAEGSLDPSADSGKLASLLLAVLRGAEALGKGGAGSNTVTDAASQALALLPRSPTAV
ncbi:TetR/AcrR family transcriptional regulator [Streptomyces sp. NPDC059215]|uniref:TetR/AcrR family transcriptional regulator n=1 Tax=Streptomyces sp. NPDC059215 TaxID=3346772 RepID=UPI00368BECE6